MSDQEGKKEVKNEVKEAFNEIAETKAGVIILKWLMWRCFFNRSTIVGNSQTYEVNSLGSVAQEFQRRLYLDIRRYIKPHLRKRIEQ